MKTLYLLYELVAKLEVLVAAYDYLFLEEQDTRSQAMFLSIKDIVDDLVKEIESNL